MKTVNLHAAKTHLSRLVDDAAAGEEIVIAKNGHPMVRLVPIAYRTTRGGFGRDKGRIVMRENFDAPLPPDVLRAFGIEP
jgi:prevent-host-death family protein